MTRGSPGKAGCGSAWTCLFWLAFLAGAAWATGGTGAIPSLEREALIAIYASNNGPNWRRQQGWLGPPGSEWNWEGVRVENGSVVELDLHENNLTGILAGEIGNLVQLRELLLGTSFISFSGTTRNRLTGLGEEFGQLINLEILDLEDNLIEELPDSFGSLSQLQELDLAKNRLTRLPESIGGLANLAVLRLRANRLTLLPESLGGLTELRQLNLGGNAIERLPESIGKLTSLERLFVDYNQLIELPASIGNLSSLGILDLAENRLTEFPESIVKLATLEELRAQKNRLALLPPNLQGWTSLRILKLQHNSLVQIPDSIGSLSRLDRLEVSNNTLRSLPDSISNLSLLSRLWASENQIQGELPPDWGELEQLNELDLSHNQITGSVPDEIFALPNLERLNLSHNQLSGELDPPMKHRGQVRRYSLSHNQFSGEITPALASLWHFRLDLSHNLLRGEIPSDMFLRRSRGINLSHNRLTGPVPPTAGPGSWGITLAGNRLSGPVPPSILRLGIYVSLDLRWNALHAESPTLAADLEEVVSVTFSDTQTIAPREIQILQVDKSQLELRWKGIEFVDTAGGYEVLYSLLPGGPYTPYGMTPDKHSRSMVISGVDLNSYFVMRTITEPHENNLNRVVSELSPEVSLRSGSLVDYEYLPILPGDTSTFAGLALSNPNSSEHGVQLEAFDRAGNPLTSPFSRVNIELMPGERRARLSDQWFGPSASNQPIFARLSSFDEGPFGSTVFIGGKGQLEGAALQIAPSPHIFFTRVLDGLDVWEIGSARTVISISNPNLQRVTVELQLFNSQPVVPAGISATVETEAITRQIPARGFLLESVTDLFSIDSPLNGYLEVTVVEGVGVLGFEWILLAEQSLVGLPAMRPSIELDIWSTTATLVPQLATSLNLVNTGSGARTVQLSLTSPVLERTLRPELSLEPGQQFQANLGHFFDLEESYEPIEVLLRFEGGDGLLADMILSEAGSTSYATRLPLADRSYRTALIAQVVQNHKLFTGLSFYNPNPSSNRVAIEVYHPDWQPTRNGLSRIRELGPYLGAALRVGSRYGNS